MTGQRHTHAEQRFVWLAVSVKEDSESLWTEEKIYKSSIDLGFSTVSDQAKRMPCVPALYVYERLRM